MSLSTPQTLVIRALEALEARDGRDAGWDEATILALARQSHRSGKKPDLATLKSLRFGRPPYIAQRQRDGRFEFTEAGRTRARGRA